MRRGEYVDQHENVLILGNAKTETLSRAYRFCPCVYKLMSPVPSTPQSVLRHEQYYSCPENGLRVDQEPKYASEKACLHTLPRVRAMARWIKRSDY